MHGPEYQPTELPVRMTPDPGAVVRMPPMVAPPSNRKVILIAGFAIAVILALGIGVGIGRATAEDPPPIVAETVTPDRGKLKVVSTPADSNVLLDGRFVGVAPLDNLDVDPGKHTIVIDVFGYQPYSGTIEVEPRGRAKLTVSLAPINTTETTTGNVSGGGTAKRLAVPPSALAPAGGPTAGAPAVAPKPTTTPRVYVPPPPQRPRRDCSGEKHNCERGCSRAETDCEFSCPTCSSCLTSMGQDECRRQCDQCRQNCKSNRRFCESTCSTQYSSCQSSN